MKIYTAARYARREELLEYAKKLSEAGHIVTARWVNGDEEGKSLEDVAVMDLDDVRAADMVLVFTDPHGSAQTGGGRHTELGLGYAYGKIIWIVGEKEQVFHSLPGVKQFSNVDEVIGALKAFGDGGTIFSRVIPTGISFVKDVNTYVQNRAEKVLSDIAPF